jgi:hypothetical protein
MSVATAVDAGTPPGESSGAPRAAGLDALASVAAQLASPTSTAGKTSSRSFLDELLGAEPPPRPRPPRGAPPRLAPRRIADPLSATLDPAAGQGIVSERAARDVRGRVANAAGDLHLFGGRASAAASDATAPLRRESLEPERQPPPSPSLRTSFHPAGLDVDAHAALRRGRATPSLSVSLGASPTVSPPPAPATARRARDPDVREVGELAAREVRSSRPFLARDDVRFDTWRDSGGGGAWSDREEEDGWLEDGLQFQLDREFSLSPPRGRHRSHPHASPLRLRGALRPPTFRAPFS